jgi:hypothetical protein
MLFNYCITLTVCGRPQSLNLQVTGTARSPIKSKEQFTRTLPNSCSVRYYPTHSESGTLPKHFMIQAIRKSCWESPPRHHRTNLRLTGLLVALPFALFRSALGALPPYLHPSARDGRDVRHVRSWLLCFALEPYFGRFPRGCRITACHTAPCLVSLCIGTISRPLSERLQDYRMSHRTLLCFALHWGHCTPAFREAREQLTN